MTLTCRAVRLQLPLADDLSSAEGPLAGHIASCLRCQAEVVRYRRLQRELRVLSGHVVAAPEHFAADVAARLAGMEPDRHGSVPRTSRVAAAAGAVVAAAGTFAVVRWMKARAAA